MATTKKLLSNSDHKFSMNASQSTYPQHSCENSVLQVLWPAEAIKVEGNLNSPHNQSNRYAFY